MCRCGCERVGVLVGYSNWLEEGGKGLGDCDINICIFIFVALQNCEGWTFGFAIPYIHNLHVPVQLNLLLYFFLPFVITNHK